MLSRSTFLAGLVPLLTLMAMPTACRGAQEPSPPPAPLFTEAERAAVRDYWSAPGRYAVVPSPTVLDRVNVTIPGSTWYWGFVRKVADQKAIDTEVAAQWEDWFKRRAAFEKALASGTLDAPDPGPIPPSLRDACGAPPPLYEHVRPNRYTVVFAPEDAPEPFVYEDAIDFGKRPAYYAYYRHANGVIRMGRRVKDYSGEDLKRLQAMFARAGKTEVERKVMQAVSSLEGGFEAINTYDTGHVSIGFIQFITAIDGTGSLSDVLLRHKTDDPADFQRTFRRFGIDVAPERVIVVVDPTTGTEKRGAEAVQAIIDDKRLTAVFERAGGTDAFRLAQLAVARSRYWPGEETVAVAVVTKYQQKPGETKPSIVETRFEPAASAPAAPPPPNPPLLPSPAASPTALAGTPATPPAPATTFTTYETRTVLTVKVSDIVRSEAGMATLMDRKVNRGNIRLINEVAAKLMQEKQLKTPQELAAHERDLVAAMKYRHDFLADPTLGQPK